MRKPGLIARGLWSGAATVISALVGPSVLLAVVLLAGMWVMVGVVTWSRWGMGLRPMSGLSRANDRSKMDTWTPARGVQASDSGLINGGASGRWIGHKANPRPDGLAPERGPFALGKQTPRSGLRGPIRSDGGDYSGEKRSFLQELALPPLPVFSPLPFSLGGCSATVGRQLLECGELPYRVSGCPHLHGVVREVVHTGETGALFDRSLLPLQWANSVLWLAGSLVFGLFVSLVWVLL